MLSITVLAGHPQLVAKTLFPEQIPPVQLSEAIEQLTHFGLHTYQRIININISI